MNGQTLEYFLNRTVEVEHSLDWKDDRFVAILVGYDKDFILFRFVDETMAIKKNKILWMSDVSRDDPPDTEYEPAPEPEEMELDLELWGSAL